MAYASGTTVPIERSQAQIQRYLVDQGAAQYMSAIDQQKGTAIIGWTLEGRMVRLQVSLPDPTREEFVYRKTANGYSSQISLPLPLARAKWEQACKARWRATLLIIRAKFEAIEAGISTFEHEFMADTVMANGKTVGAWVAPQLQAMYDGGKMPALLPDHMRE